MGRQVTVLAEREVSPGWFEGYTENYTPALIPGNALGAKIISAMGREIRDGFLICEPLAE